MSSSNLNARPRGIPDEFRAIPIHGGAVEGSLRACVVVRLKSDPIGGRFVMLRDLPIATVYLGCLVDAAGALWDWIEIWVQKVRDPGVDLASFPDCGNQTLDTLWARELEALRELQPEDQLDLGWERTPTLPTFIDTESWEPVHPVDTATGEQWKLCRDDTLLEAHGLPAYTRSLHRYLHLEGAPPEKARFMVTAPDAPKTEAVMELEAVAHGSGKWTPFNPGAGCLAARRFFPLGLEDYLDLLGGKPWSGPGHGIDRIKLGGSYEAIGDPTRLESGRAQLYLGQPTLGNRLIEGFYLKLWVLAEAMRLIRAYVAQAQRPLFNLSPESFRVRLEGLGHGLPALWSAGLALVQPGHAVALPVETTGHKRFLPLSGGYRSVYLPENLGSVVHGAASLRIRNLSVSDDGLVRIEGTVVSQDAGAPQTNDLACVGVVLGGRTIKLYGNWARIEPAAPGEARFSGLPQSLDAATVAALRAAEGVPIARVSLAVIPALGTPCDVYSLGVLAVRALLVDEDTTLPMALDDVFSLARQVEVQGESSLKLAQRIQRELDGNPRWRAVLGPHRLLAEKVDPTKAADLVPARLWSETLAAMIALFPGSSSDRLCQGFGDAPELAPEQVFDAPLEAFARLMRMARGLIVTDWTLHQDVRTAIERCRGSLTV